MEKMVQENHIEKSLTTKGEQSLLFRLKQKNLTLLWKKAGGIIFYAATFIVSVAVGYIFIFSVFN